MSGWEVVLRPHFHVSAWQESWRKCKCVLWELMRTGFKGENVPSTWSFMKTCCLCIAFYTRKLLEAITRSSAHSPWWRRGTGRFHNLGLSGIQCLEMGYQSFEIFLEADKHHMSDVSLNPTMGPKAWGGFPTVHRQNLTHAKLLRASPYR